jgi:E3 ubiquitin-protein ligase MARCH6
MGSQSEDIDDSNEDLCRFCRGPNSPEHPLYYPCLCIGSIKYIHQECLTSWLRHSGREYCELCKHKFTFHPIYRNDMPPRLPLTVLLAGLYSRVSSTVWRHAHNLLVAVAWLIIVPLCACRITRCLYSGSLRTLLIIPWDLFSQQHVFVDVFQGALIVGMNVGTFLAYVYLRDQIQHVGGPAWMQELLDLEAQNRENGEEPAAENVHAENREPNVDENLVPILELPEPQPHVAVVVRNEQDPPPLLPPVVNVAENVNNPVERIQPQPQPRNNVAPQVANAPHPRRPANVPHAAGGGFFRWLLPAMLEAAVQPQGLHVPGAPQVNPRHEPVNEAHNQEAPGDNLLALLQMGAGPIVLADGDVPHGHVPNEAGPQPPAPPPAPPINEEPPLEEFTWERLFGLDGSMVFLEHVFGVISLNTLFTLIFSFCPYHIGRFILAIFNSQLKIVNFPLVIGLVHCAVGYVVIAAWLLVAYYALLRFHQLKFCRMVASAYLIIKVSLVAGMELGVFPLLCGLWIDVCSLRMFNATIAERVTSLYYSPMTFTCMHWMVGMMYVVYVVSFALLARSMLRPGLLWFIRDINDQEFNPVTEMIQQSVALHARRYLINIVLVGFTVVLLIWLPGEILRSWSLVVLPFSIHIANKSPLDYFIEIFFLQMLLPLIFDVRVKSWLKVLVLYWCRIAAWILGMQSYILGNKDYTPGDEVVLPNGSRFKLTTSLTREAMQRLIDQHLREAEQAHRRQQAREGRANGAGVAGQPFLIRPYSPYIRPSYFGLRLTMLLVLLMCSCVVCSVFVMTIPIALGRSLTRHVLPRHDLLAVIVAFASLGLVSKILVNFPVEIPLRHHDFHRLGQRVKNGAICLFKCTFLFLIFGMFVPVLLGILVNLVLVSPFRIPSDKTLVFSFWEHWLFGVMHLKVLVLVSLLGPMWWMRQAVEQIQDELFRRENMRVMLILNRSMPGLCLLTISLTAPYCMAFTISPLFNFNPYEVFRSIYLYSTVLGTLLLILYVQIKQVKRLYNRIKDETYLIGQRLANYEPSSFNQREENGHLDQSRGVLVAVNGDN